MKSNQPPSANTSVNTSTRPVLADAPKPRGQVTPSKTDPVQRWLDVFVPMTGLSKTRQQDIRAELEDHLRARVDDLLITGISEPEAVQQAVSELGETAHLAKQFRTALKPKGKKIMHTTLIALAGSALTLGIFATLNPSPTIPAQVATVAPFSATTDDYLRNAVSTEDYSFAKGGTIDLRTATLGSIFEQVRTNLDRPLVVHWEHLDEIGIAKSKPLSLDADPMPTETALRIAIERTATQDFGRIAVVTAPDAIEITTTEYLDHRTKQIKPHDITELIAHYEVPRVIQVAPPNPPVTTRNRETAERAGREVLEAVMELASRHAWTDNGGDLATARIVGGSLIVDAPASIHTEVEQVIKMMQVEVDRFIESKKAVAAQTELEKAARIDQLSAARNELRGSISALAAEVQRLDLERRKALESASSVAMAIRHLKMGNPEELRRNNPHNAYYQLRPEELADIETESGERAVSLEAQITDIQIRLQDLRSEREMISSDLVELGYRSAITSRNIRLLPAREELEAAVRARGVSQDELRDADGNLDIEKVNKAFGGRATLSGDRRNGADQN